VPDLLGAQLGLLRLEPGRLERFGAVLDADDRALRQRRRHRGAAARPVRSAGEQAAKDARGDAMHHDEPVSFLRFVLRHPRAEAAGDVVIPFAARGAAGEQAGPGIHETAMGLGDLGIETSAPVAHVHFRQTRVGAGAMPVEAKMLGNDGESLEGAAGGRCPQSERRRRAERGEKRLPYLLRVAEAGAGERRMGGVALHPPGGVEHGLAVPGDEPARRPHRRRAQAMAAASIAVATPRSS
jgi:hypothetical protein